MSPKSPRIELSNDALSNGNVVKFSHTNRKHFTVFDSMAFPIVKMGNKPPNVPFPLHDVDLHLIQQCLGATHAPPQTAAPTVEALSHTYAAKSPLVTMARPKFPPKVPFPVDRSQTPLHVSSLDPSDLWCKTHPDPLRRFSTMHWTDRRTDRPQTDRSSTGKFDRYRPLRYESDAA